MRRRSRYQNGHVELTDANTWKAHWYEYITDESGQQKRVHRSKIVGAKSRMTKFQARDEMKKIVAPINNNAVRKDASVTLSWFIKHRWKPMHAANWRDTSKITYEQHLAYINKTLGDLQLGEFDKVRLQQWANAQVPEYKAATINARVTRLKSIFAEAVEQDFLPKDPARKLKTPATAEKSDETVLEWFHYPQILTAATSTRDRLIIKLASSTAVRPEELFAFRWKCLRAIELKDSRTAETESRYVLDIQETFHRGKLRPFAKTDGSKDYVALPRDLYEELKAWRDETNFPADDEPIFPNTLGKFQKADHFVTKVLHAIRDALKIDGLNFQILRRSFATRVLADGKGSLKDIQKQLRHKKPNMALERYVKSVPESVFEMVDAVYGEMMGEPKGGVQ